MSYSAWSDDQCLPKVNSCQVVAAAPLPDGRWLIVAEWNPGGPSEAVLATVATLADREWQAGRYVDTYALAFTLFAERIAAEYLAAARG